MKIELKNIKYAAFASEETSCFEGTLYIEGKKATRVSNEGRGGPNLWDEWEVQKRVNEYAKTLPPVTTSIKNADGTFWICEQDADTLVDDLLNDHLVAKDLKRDLGKRLLFMKDGALMQTKAIPRAQLAHYIAKPDETRKSLDSEEVLNLLPFAKALELYKGAGA